jgi:hypothetical protein
MPLPRIGPTLGGDSNDKRSHFLFPFGVRALCSLAQARIALIGMSFPALLLLTYRCLFLP